MISRTFVRGGVLPSSAEKQSVYSTAPADWEIHTIQFSINRQFRCQTVLFDPLIGPYQVLPLRARVDPGVMARKSTPHSTKLQHYWNFTIKLLSVISRTLVGGGTIPQQRSSWYSQQSQLTRPLGSQRFSLSRCICKKFLIICVICISSSFCGISSVSFLFFKVRNNLLSLELLTSVESV